MVRSIDLLPLLVFGFFWTIHSYRRTPNFNFRDYLRQSRRIIFLISIPVTLLIGLLIFGKTVVGHWGFSAGEAPQPWISYWYLTTLGQEWSAGVPFLKLLEHAVFWFVNNVMNKIGYFTDDFIFMAGASKILGVYRFVTELEIPGLTVTARIVNAAVSLGILGSVFYQVAKDRTCKSVWTVFLWAGLGGWAAWTFLLNHYEPRYWTAVFLCWTVGLAGPYVVRLQAVSAEKKKFVYAGTVALLAYLVVFTLNHLTLAIIPSASRRLAVAWRWQEMATETCKKEENYIWRIPYPYFTSSTFRYFVAQTCSRIEVMCLEADQFDRCKYPENPEHKVVVDMPIDVIDPGHSF